MPTAYSYARFSSDRQHESSIEAQQDAIRKWAEARDVYIVHEFVDRGISGTTDERPAFQEMIVACQVRKVDYVLVHKHDRFARNRYDAVIYGRVIEKAGARLVAVAQDFGDAPEAVILEGLMQAWSEYYSRNLSTETKKGLSVRAKKGLSIGGITPFGYRQTESGSSLEIVESEAVWVRAFYEAYLNGENLSGTIKAANRAGMRGRKGIRLTRDAVIKMIRNPVYRGTYRVVIDGKETMIENHHPAIVSPEIWKEAKHKMEARLQSPKTEDEKTYLLTGLTRCGICGKRIRAQTQKQAGHEYPYYYCGNSAEHPDGHRLRAIRVDALDESIRQYIHTLLSPEARDAATRALADYIRGRKKDAKRREPEAKKRIRDCERKIETIMENMSSGVLPPSVLKRMGDQITELEAEIEIQQQIMQAPPDPDLPNIAEFFKDAADIDENTPIEEAQKIARRFVSSVTITNDEIIIESTFADWLKSKGVEFYSKKDSGFPEDIFDIKIRRTHKRGGREPLSVSSALLCKLRIPA